MHLPNLWSMEVGRSRIGMWSWNNLKKRRKVGLNSIEDNDDTIWFPISDLMFCQSDWSISRDLVQSYNNSDWGIDKQGKLGNQVETNKSTTIRSKDTASKIETVEQNCEFVSFSKWKLVLKEDTFLDNDIVKFSTSIRFEIVSFSLLQKLVAAK